jgi:hypothetical protein
MPEDGKYRGYVAINILTYLFAIWKRFFQGSLVDVHDLCRELAHIRFD